MSPSRLLQFTFFGAHWKIAQLFSKVNARVCSLFNQRPRVKAATLKSSRILQNTEAGWGGRQELNYSKSSYERQILIYSCLEYSYFMKASLPVVSPLFALDRRQFNSLCSLCRIAKTVSISPTFHALHDVNKIWYNGCSAAPVQLCTQQRSNSPPMPFLSPRAKNKLINVFSGSIPLWMNKIQITGIFSHCGMSKNDKDKGWLSKCSDQSLPPTHE